MMDPNTVVEELEPGTPEYHAAADLLDTLREQVASAVAPAVTHRAIFKVGDATVHDFNRPVAKPVKKDPWRQSFYK